MTEEELILKTIIEKHDYESLGCIGSREEIVFPTLSHIYNAIYNAYINHDSIPNYGYLNQFFELAKDTEAIETLERIKNMPLVENKATALIENVLNAYAKAEMTKLLNLTKNQIVGNANNTQKFAEELINKIASINNVCKLNESKAGILHGQSARDRFRQTYDRQKLGFGNTSHSFGFSFMDNTLKGFTRQDLIFVMGYVGQGKSMLLRALAYNCLQQGLNVLYFPLETSRDDTERQFYTLHANNPLRFPSRENITVSSIKNGTLTKREEDYLFDTVIPDFTEAENLGTLYIIQPEADDYSMDDLKHDIRNIHTTIMPVDVVVVDYITLLRPENKTKYIDSGMVNRMVTSLRKFQLAFDGGRGVSIMSACQVSRHGYNSMIADKEHYYSLTAIGDYSSIERDGTIVLSIARTEEDIQAKQARVQCLKSRDERPFEQNLIMFDGSTGQLTGVKQIESSEEALDQLASIDL